MDNFSTKPKADEASLLSLAKRLSMLTTEEFTSLIRKVRKEAVIH